VAPVGFRRLAAARAGRLGLRLAHSLIHLTTNNVRQRLMVFALSNFALVTLWIWFLRRVI
jgi:hypothetical protein